MKITLLSYGSRGDVQPFVALARGLRRRAHEVKLAAPHRFQEFASRYDIPFVPLAGDPEVISRRINDAGTNAVRVIASIWDYLFKIAPQVSRSAFAACEGAEAIVHSFLFTVGGHSWARERGIADVSVMTFPMFAPTREFPNVAAAGLPSGWLSYLSHWLATQIFWYGGNMGYGPARRANPDIPYPKKLDWPFDSRRPLRFRTPMLCAYSPAVLPRPADWGENIHVTGYLFLDQERDNATSEVVAFMQSGPAPVCVTFGSMLHQNAGQIARTLLEAFSKTGDRAIFLTGWNGYQPEKRLENFLFIEDIPHDWLFPRCKAIIHHGGAGTTGAGLRAGVPNIVLPHTADQPFWGLRVQNLGAGPRPIPLKKLSVKKVIHALEQAGSGAILERAADLGRRIRAEDGVAQAVRLIEAHTAGPSSGIQVLPSRYRTV
jgi:sterol 3beta-glucosyltransferase